MSRSNAPHVRLLCGAQHLYGPGPLERVALHARELAAELEAADAIPLAVRSGEPLTTPEEIRRAFVAANADDACAGVIVWMHTFSPGRMWIRGLGELRKPLCHLHTQYARDLPWDALDMDYMNLHQAAHGDREAGHLHGRMGLRRKVVVGHWRDDAVQARLGAWMHAAHAWHDLQGARFARFGDTMRDVAVTEGDKVDAERRFGFSVNGYGVGDLAARVADADESAVDALIEAYLSAYRVAAELRPGGARHDALRDGARIEAGLRDFLDDGGFKGFTTTFEDLHGLRQLPGLAVQRLLADGYGFGAEGDWKTAALVRAMKVMAGGRPGGTSFMEDYTYDLGPGGPRVLGAHMLEVCPSIAADVPSLEIHPLAIGGKDDPVRLVFAAPPGPAVQASLTYAGTHFRLVVAEVDVVDPPDLPRLPVARALWTCRPDFATATAAWIHAGGAHHTAFSQAVATEDVEDFARIVDAELVVIDETTLLRELEGRLRLNAMYHALASGLPR